MKICCISDTHGQHRCKSLVIPKCDLLIHAGDITGRGSPQVIKDFNDWIGELRDANTIDTAVVIPGNHDLTFDPVKASQPCIDDVISLCTNFELLIDDGIELDGLQIWGSPYTPEFNDWAFNKARGAELEEHWEKIPDFLDILITHGPPYGYRDKATVQHLGDSDLRGTLAALEEDGKQPRVHIFGHIHGGYGMAVGNGTLFINASVLDEDYKVVNQPIVFTI